MEAIEESLKLGTWTDERRVIITRKPTRKSSSVKALGNEENSQQEFDLSPAMRVESYMNMRYS